MHGSPEALKLPPLKRPGRVDLWTAVVTGALGLVLSCASAVGATVWTRYNAAEDMRRQTAANTEDIAQLRAEVRRMAAQVERVLAAADAMQNSVERLEAQVTARPRVRPASGH